MYSLDIPAGSAAERSLVRSLVEYFEARGLPTRVIPVEVLEWGEIECWINDISCTAQPPIRNSEVSGTLGRDVLISSTTKDPDNVWATYWSSVEKGASAIVFYDEYPNIGRRRIVVNEIPSYSSKTKMRADIPAVHIPQITLANLKKSREVNISVRTLKRVSQGSTIEVFTGDREPKVLVTTHHDRWLTGFRDNSMGVLIVMKLVELLSKLNIPARLVSFTGEEFGDPSESSFYWAYGSRIYSKQVVDSDIDLAVVVDTAHVEPVEVDIAGVRGLESRLGLIKVSERPIGIGYTDAASLVAEGIPSLVLHNLSSIKPVYHTDADRYPGRSAEAIITKIARSIVNVVKEFEKGDVRQLYRAYVEQVYRTSPPDIRNYLMATLDYTALSKCLIKHYTALAIEGTYRDYYTEIRLLTYSDILRGIESGFKYTILYEDVEVDLSDADLIRETAKTRIEEVVSCYKK
ncbi:MAG: M28 family peptidase [Sulfolobales archaeon]|nr:M28 family peptidase [Sulfolobales archaeon]MDW8083413.1 M28 family peptidase [Sulfolobales archaeon]